MAPSAPRSRGGRLPLLAAVPALAAAGAASGQTPVTFNRDVAPIVLEHCAGCHRPGESAPFNLLTYADARKRAQQIAAVVADRYMPPWLPAQGRGRFRGERRLTDAQIAVIQRWVSDGLVEGDAADLPVAPRWVEGWQLGEPDLIVEMPEPYLLRAEGSDDFRNFVVPLPVEQVRWVEAVELRPGNPRVVHHAVMQVDTTGDTRRRDAEADGPGFPGMDMGRSRLPDGHFLGWTPGRLPHREPGMAWRLEPGTDLVLQLHMVPSGKPEPIRARIGLHFTDEAPTLRPSVLLLRNDDIDIPPGAGDYAVEDAFELPVPVTVTGIYPHAHYVGKDLQAYAMLPDGGRRWLLHIDDWDFNWQDEYRYAEPVPLPAGSTIVMRYTFDNSAKNVRNPNQPPARVTFGERSIDEMATLTVQVLPESADGAAALDRAFREKVQTRFIAYAIQYLRTHPDDADKLADLGSAYVTVGRTQDALGLLQRSIELRPDHAGTRATLAGALSLLGRHEEAVNEYRTALRARPDDAHLHGNLGVGLANLGQPDAAMREYRRAIELDPDLFNAYLNLARAHAARDELARAEHVLREALARRAGLPTITRALASILKQQERWSELMTLYERFLAADDRHPDLHVELADLCVRGGRLESAIRHYRAAIELSPGTGELYDRLARVLVRTRAVDDAIVTLLEGLAVRPDAVPLRTTLAGVYLLDDQPLDAIRQFREAMRLEPTEPAHLNSIAWVLATTPDRSVRSPEQAVALAQRAADMTDHENASILDTLATSYAAAGQFEEAVQMARRAIHVARTTANAAAVQQMERRLELFRARRPYIENR